MTDISISYSDGSTIKNADAILQQYEIALFTVPGEFSGEPDFGIGVQQWVAEPNNELSAQSLKQHIEAKTANMFSEIAISSLKIFQSAANSSVLTIELNVIILPYNQQRTITKDVTNN